MWNIQLVLQRYAAWVAADNSGVDWNHTAAGFAALLSGGRRCRPQCSDNDGLAIDGAMKCLRKNNLYYYELLGMYYIKRMTLRKIGKKLAISHSEVAKRVQCAEGFVEGCLAMADIVLEMDDAVQEITPDKHVA